MISGEGRHTRCVMGRLEEGEDVVRALADLARFEKIDAGFVRGAGVVADAELLLWRPASRRHETIDAPALAGRPAELVSLDGNVSLRDGVPDVRLWAALAVETEGQPRVLGGLLARARVVSVEFAIDVLDDGDLERRDDAGVGHPVWRPPRRR